ncbi:Ubiquitin fusion degradation protein 4, partial [Kappamyces sp. JEL0680]
MGTCAGPSTQLSAHSKDAGEGRRRNRGRQPDPEPLLQNTGLLAEKEAADRAAGGMGCSLAKDDDVDLEAEEASNDSAEEEEVQPFAPGQNALLLQRLVSADKHQVLEALQELSEVLVVANEEDFIRSSNPINTSALAKTLISLLESSPDPFFLDIHAELLILACRCLYNLLEANPGASTTIAHSRGVEVLVDKLMEIEFIDLAETALKVLDRIATDYPSTILKANGLFACLQYLDFFGIHVQRTAVSIVANTCRSLPAFPTLNAQSSRAAEASQQALDKVMTVIDTIVRLVEYSDPKIVDNAAKSLQRIAEWSSRSPEKMQALFKKQHLETLANRIVVYSDYKQSETNNVFLLLLRTLSCVAKASQQLCHVLIKELGALSIFRTIIIGQVDQPQIDLTGFAVSRPTEQVMAILDFLGDVLPELEPKGVWRVSPDEPNKVSAAEPSFDQEVLAEYVELIFPLLFDVFMVSSLQTVRKRVVLCVSRVIAMATPERLSASLKKSKSFGKFVFELIHYHKSCIESLADLDTTVSASTKDEHLLVFAGLGIVLTVVDRCSPEFRGWFSREGVDAEVALLAEKCPRKQDEIGPLTEPHLSESSPTTQSPLEPSQTDPSSITALFQDFLSGAAEATPEDTAQL